MYLFRGIAERLTPLSGGNKGNFIDTEMETKKNKYTCSEYRAEMILLGLTRRLNQEDLPPGEKQALIEEIDKLKSAMGMD